MIICIAAFLVFLLMYVVSTNIRTRSLKKDAVGAWIWVWVLLTLFTVFGILTLSKLFV